MRPQFCFHCGGPLSADAKFCGRCGTPVQNYTLPVEPAPVPESEIPAVPVVEPVVEFQPPVIPEPAPPLASTIFTLDTLEDPTPEAPAPQSEAPSLEPQPPVHTEPPVCAPIPQPAPSPEPKALKHGILVRRGVGRTILAVLLCIVIFLWSFVTVLMIDLRAATTGDTCADTIESALRSLDLTEVPATALIINADEDMTLADWILYKAQQNYSGKVSADGDTLQEFLEDSELIPFLAEHLSSYINDLYNGNTGKNLTADDIEDFLWDERSGMRAIFGQEITRDSAKRLAAAFEDSGVLDLLNTRTLKSEYSGLYSVLTLALSWWVLAILLVVLVLLLMLLNAVNRSILRTCSDFGITLMVASGLWGLAGLICLVLPGVWDLILPIDLVNTLTGSLLKSCLVPTAAAFGTGVVLVLIRVLGKKIVLARAAKKA